jgi:hypothetical protein
VPIYVWHNKTTGEVREERISTYEPELSRPGPEWSLVIQTSLVVFGDFILGDDDFSRRYHLNGKAGQYGGKPNRTQNHTNVNPMLRKWGKKGRPLELNPDIDTTKSWDASKGTPAGVDPATAAPRELQSSEAKGTSVRDV